jgi:hypothetical protein
VQQAFFSEGPVKRKEEWFLPVVGEEEPFCWADPERRCTERPWATRAMVCPSCPRFAAKGVLSLEGVPGRLVPLLPLLAQLTALALKNGELMAERNQALARLSRHAEALSQVTALAREVARLLEPEAVLETLARALAERFGFYRVTVALVRGEVLEGYLTVKEGRVYWTEGRSRLRLSLASSPDPLARAAREKVSLLLPKEALPPKMAQDVGPSVAFVPVLAEDRVLGVLVMDYGPAGGPVRDEDLRYVELLAQAAGVAYRNAELFR